MLAGNLLSCQLFHCPVNFFKPSAVREKLLCPCKSSPHSVKSTFSLCTCKGSQADRLLAHNHATDADICAGGRCDELHVHACSFACVCVCISASVYVFVCMRVYLCAYICAQVYNLLPGVNGEKTQGFTQGATYDTRTGVSVCLLACLSAIFCLCTWAGCVPMTQKVN